MVTEIARLTIDPARAAAFETAISEAAEIFRAAVGCQGMSLSRGLENPAQYLLLVEWESIEHHMTTFRESDGFERWRAIAGPFFTASPAVEHTTHVASYF